MSLIYEIDEADKLRQALTARCHEELLRQPCFFPDQDLFLAEVAGSLVGYAELTREMEIGRVVVLRGGVHPRYRYQGIGTGLLDAVMEQGRKIGAPVLHVPVAQHMTLGRRFLEHHGFAEVHRQRQMRLTIDRRGGMPSLPAGMELCPLLPGEEVELALLQNRIFATSWGFHPNTVEEVKGRLSLRTSQPQGVMVLKEKGKMVGYCWTTVMEGRQGGRETDRGCIFMIGVEPAYQGKGLGRALLLAGVQYLHRRGLRTVELTVNSENLPAYGLYRSLGFEEVAEILWYEKVLR